MVATRRSKWANTFVPIQVDRTGQPIDDLLNDWKHDTLGVRSSTSTITVNASRSFPHPTLPRPVPRSDQAPRDLPLSRSMSSASHNDIAGGRASRAHRLRRLAGSLGDDDARESQAQKAFGRPRSIHTRPDTPPGRPSTPPLPILESSTPSTPPLSQISSENGGSPTEAHAVEQTTGSVGFDGHLEVSNDAEEHLDPVCRTDTWLDSQDQRGIPRPESDPSVMEEEEEPQSQQEFESITTAAQRAVRKSTPSILAKHRQQASDPRPMKKQKVIEAPSMTPDQKRLREFLGWPSSIYTLNGSYSPPDTPLSTSGSAVLLASPPLRLRGGCGPIGFSSPGTSEDQDIPVANSRRLFWAPPQNEHPCRPIQHACCPTATSQYAEKTIQVASGYTDQRAVLLTISCADAPWPPPQQLPAQLETAKVTFDPSSDWFRRPPPAEFQVETATFWQREHHRSFETFHFADRESMGGPTHGLAPADLPRTCSDRRPASDVLARKQAETRARAQAKVKERARKAASDPNKTRKYKRVRGILVPEAAASAARKRRAKTCRKRAGDAREGDGSEAAATETNAQPRKVPRRSVTITTAKRAKATQQVRIAKRDALPSGGTTLEARPSPSRSTTLLPYPMISDSDDFAKELGAQAASSESFGPNSSEDPTVFAGLTGTSMPNQPPTTYRGIFKTETVIAFPRGQGSGPALPPASPPQRDPLQRPVERATLSPSFESALPAVAMGEIEAPIQSQAQNLGTSPLLVSRPSMPRGAHVHVHRGPSSSTPTSAGDFIGGRGTHEDMHQASSVAPGPLPLSRQEWCELAEVYARYRQSAQTAKWKLLDMVQNPIYDFGNWEIVETLCAHVQWLQPELARHDTFLRFQPSLYANTVQTCFARAAFDLRTRTIADIRSRSLRTSRDGVRAITTLRKVLELARQSWPSSELVGHIQHSLNWIEVEIEA